MFRNETVLGLDGRMTKYNIYNLIQVSELLHAEARRSSKFVVNSYASVK
jgi:hypothetical protein